MSRFRRFEIIESSPSFFLEEASIFTPKIQFLNPRFPLISVDELDFSLDLFNPNPIFDFTSPFGCFDTITDLLQISSTRKIQRRVERPDTNICLQTLCDRLSDLELRLAKKKKPFKADRKYTWTAEIKSPDKDGVDRKYEWTADIKGGDKKKYKWTAEIKGKGEDAAASRTYTFKASTGNAGEGTASVVKNKDHDVKKKKNNNKAAVPARIVEIEECNDHGAVVLRKAFAKRGEAVEKSKGKRKELSPQDAAMTIQITFRAYLIRRSQTLRALRELAVAKTKLKEIRAFFNNFSYRRRIAGDAEERQRFSEKIIVLLLTVDAIEGADLMVRGAKRSMVDELEAMLDVVDPQPQGKSLSIKRRAFDMPDGVLHKELAAGVAEVVRMLDEETNDE